MSDGPPNLTEVISAIFAFGVLTWMSARGVSAAWQAFAAGADAPPDE